MNFQREQHRTSRSQGFTLLEMVIALAIAMVMMLVAIPLVNQVTSSLKIQGATAAVTGAIQSTRYQAIFQGCSYQLAFTAATSSYQIQNEPPTGGVCAATFSNVCPPGVTSTSCPVPWSGTGSAVTIGADATMTFTPGGRVTGTLGAACPCTMVLSSNGRTSTITVSNFGNINVQYAP